MVKVDLIKLEEEEKKNINEVRHTLSVFIVCQKCLRVIGSKSDFSRINRMYWRVRECDLDIFTDLYYENEAAINLYCGCGNQIGIGERINNTKFVKVFRKNVKIVTD